MIRNSDFVFGKIAVTQKFLPKEQVKKAIKLVSSLQVLGINKRLAQLLYEQKLLDEREIYAIQYAMVQSGHAKKIKSIRTYRFTEEDNQILLAELGLREHQSDTSEDPPTVSEEKAAALDLSSRKIQVCLNIQKSLAKSGFQVPLLQIVHDKKLLTEKVKALIPDITSKRREITREKMSKSKIRECVAVLLGQVAVNHGKISKDQRDRSIVVWEKTYEDHQIRLKYSEILFYLNYLSQEDCVHISSMAYKLFKIDQMPRFHLFHLSPQEKEFFQSLNEKGLLKARLVEECHEKLQQLQEMGLQLELSEILIMRGYLTRKAIANKWAKSRKEEVALKVKQMQMDRTEETMVDYNSAEEVAQTERKKEEIYQQVEQDTQEHQIALGQYPNKYAEQDEQDSAIEEEFSQDFLESQQQQKASLQQELQDLKKKREDANEEQLKTIDTVIQHYQQTYASLRFYFLMVLASLLLVGAGFYLAWTFPNSQPPRVSPQPKEKKQATQENWQQLRQQADSAYLRYDFSQAMQLYEFLLQKSTIDKDTIREKIKQSRLHLDLIETAAQKVRESSGISIHLKGKSHLRILSLADNRIVFWHPAKRQEWILHFYELTPQEFFQLFVACGLLKEVPLKLAHFCFEHNMISQAKKSLYYYIEKYPHRKQQAWELLAAKTTKEIPPGGFISFQEQLLTPREFSRLQSQLPPNDKDPKSEEQSTSSPSEPTSQEEKKFQEQLWQRLQSQYALEMQRQGAVFYRDRWSFPATVAKEKKLRQRRQAGETFFAGQWYQKKELGEWYRLKLRKGVEQGFLQQKQSNLYQLRTFSGVRYINENQILTKTKEASPWELYWLKSDSIANPQVTKHLQIAQWCLEQGFAFLAQIQFEKVLTQAPFQAQARAYLASKFPEHWQSRSQDEDLVIEFLKNWSFPAQQALVEIRSQKQEKPENLWQEVFGGNPRREGTRWYLRYNFADNMTLGPWQNIGEHGESGKITIAEGKLQLHSQQLTPLLAYLNIDFQGDLLVKYRFRIASGKENIHTKIYVDPHAPENSGYLFSFNKRGQATSKQLSNVLQTYVKNQITQLDQVTSPTIPAGRWYTAAILVRDEKLKFSIAGQRILAASNQEYRRGALALGAENSTVEYDDLEILAQVSPEWYQHREREVKQSLIKKQGQQQTYQGFSYASLESLLQASQESIALWQKGCELFQEQQYQQAWQLWNQAIEKDNKVAHYYVARALIFLHYHNYPGALADLQKALNLDPKLYTAHLLKARVFQERGEDNAALLALEKTLSLAPENFLAYHALSLLFLKKNQPQEALRIAKELTSKDKQTGERLLKEIRALIQREKKQDFPQISAHCRLYAEKIPASEQQQLAQIFEQFLSSYQKKTQTVVGDEMFVVRAFSDFTSYRSYLALANPQSHKRVAWYWPVTGEIVVCLATHPNILRQELVEQASKQLFAKNAYFPPAIQTALDKYFSQTSSRSDTFQAGEPLWCEIYQIRQLIDQEKFMALDQLFALDQQSFYDVTKHSHHALLSYAWLFFLLEGEGEKYREKFYLFLALLHKGEEPKTALNKAFADVNFLQLHDLATKYWLTIGDFSHK